MTRSPHGIGLICLAVFSGCQSLDSSVLPWQTTKYKTAEEVAAMNNPQPVAAHAEGEQEILQTVTASASSQPISTGRVEQLIQSGRAALGEGQTPTQLGRARQDFQQALNLDSGNTDAHHGIAIVADLEEDWLAAEFHYKQALQQRPQDPGILNDLGYSYLLQNRYHDASQYLRQALHVSPQHEHAHINLALLALKRGDRRAAESQLSEIYSPGDIKTTIARLEQDLQSADADSLQVDVSQPLNASFEETKRLMAEERARAQRDRQEKAIREQQRLTAGKSQTQTGRSTPPSSQYGITQPNIPVYAAVSDTRKTLTENMVSSPGYQTNPPSNIQAPGAGAAPGGTFVNVPVNSYPMGAPSAQINQVAAHNTPPQFSVNQSIQYPQRGLRPPQAAFHAAPPALYERQLQHEQSTGDGLQAQQLQPQFTPRVSPVQGLIQQVTQPQISNRDGPPPTVTPQQNYRTPLAGLNAGPGALFPINAGNVSPSTAGMNQIQSPGSQVSVQTRYSGQQTGGRPTMMPGTNTMINGGMYQQPPRVLPAEQHMQQIQQMRYSQENSAPTMEPPVSAVPSVGRPTFAAGGVLTPMGLSPQNQAVQQAGQQMPGRPAMTQTASQGVQPGSKQRGAVRTPTAQLHSVAAPSPLAAYEQQLQGLNSQYNQAIEQTGDSGAALSPVQARY
jgi:Tfp pilus assembly protein PilF